MRRKPSKKVAGVGDKRSGRGRSLSDAELESVSAARGPSVKTALPDTCKTPAPPTPLPIPYPNT
jgi:hypothetical protein